MSNKLGKKSGIKLPLAILNSRIFIVSDVSEKFWDCVVGFRVKIWTGETQTANQE